MIDLTLLREFPDSITHKIHKKDPYFEVNKLIDLDHKVRLLRIAIEELRCTKNELATVAKGGITAAIREKSIQIGMILKEKEAQLASQEKEFAELYLRCPNIPSDDLPEGNKEANLVVKVFEEKPVFSFKPKHHLELGMALQWFDIPAASTMTGAGFILYKQPAAQLMYALVMFMLKHNMEHGYQLMLPPYLVNERSLEIASNFPKFKEEVYTLIPDNLYLIPTAEVSLANLHRDTIFDSTQLPLRYTAATSCFRREAGGYGAAERGLIRIHQFEKAELFTYCLPEHSNAELERMLTCAEELLKKLGLHYRVSLLAAQDCSFPAAKTYDIEIWMPGQQEYKEVSSCSNCTDFQARRGLVRYKNTQTHKNNFVHTLNGSSLALPRLIAALMETYQQPDGTIAVPKVLKEYGVY